MAWARTLVAVRRRLRGGLRAGLLLLGTGAFPALYAVDAVASEDLVFEELGGDHCFMFFQLVPKKLEGNHYVTLPLQLVINDDRDFRRLFDPKLLTLNCSQADPSTLIPKVDFSKKTVLGFWTSGVCFNTEFKRKLSRDDIKKQVTYTVTALGTPRSCRGQGPRSLNLIAVPKIPSGYEVIFASAVE